MVQYRGYVPTGYSARSTSTVITEVKRYPQFYPSTISGIFFDETSANDAAYMKTVSDATKAAGLNYIVYNPGTTATSAYFSQANLVVSAEHGTAGFKPVTSNPGQNAAIIYDTSDLAGMVKSTVNYGGVYFTK